MTRFMDRNVIVGALIVAMIACAAATILKDREVGQSAVSLESPRSEPSSPQPRRLVSPLVPEQQRALAAADDHADAALRAQVEHKYRFLIADVGQEHVDELRRRLLERESEIDLNSRARMDAGIGSLLPADSFAYYQALKDSDLEQHHLAEYTGGVCNVAPLDQRQERLVLDAKLRQKQRYATVMRDVGFERETLSVEERAFAHTRAKESLQQYLDEFLVEVQPSLTPEQYLQLKNYETTEFARELSRLQQRINAK